MAQKLVAVVGGTGTQGGSVINALLESGRYRIRSLTRDASSSASKALAAKGIEMVEATLMDKPSLVKAFDSAYAVFGLTMPNTGDSEEEQGRNLVDACNECNVDLFIWSSLPDGTAVSNGKYTKIKHWDEKAAVDKYIKSIGHPAVILHTGNFSENLLNYHMFGPSKSDPGAFDLMQLIVRPTVPVAHTWVGADLGPLVCAIIDNWEDPAIKDKLTKQVIPVISFRITWDVMIDKIQRITGKAVHYVRVPGINNEEMSQMLHLIDDDFRPPHMRVAPPVLAEIGVKFSTPDDFVQKIIAPYVNAKQ